MTPAVVHLPEHLRRRILEHCLSRLPHEACGLLAFDGDRVVEVYPTDNQDESAFSYTVPPEQHMDALTVAESNGWTLGGVFHSHPRGPANMSPVDIARALDHDWLYVVVALADGVEWAAWRGGQDVEIV